MTRFIGTWVATTACVAQYWFPATSALSAPACQTAAAPMQSTLNVTLGNLTSSPGDPFGLVYASNDIAFAALDSGYVSVLNTSSFTPTLIREIPLPEPFHIYGVGACTITHDKQIVYVSTGPGAVAIDVKKAVAGDTKSVVGVLIGTVGTSAIQATLSSDDKYLFVSQEYGNNATGCEIRSCHGAVEVFNVHRAKNGSVSSTFIGFIALDYAVVGMALSPDGHKLYVTSEAASLNTTRGTLSVLDVPTLKSNPANALLTTVDAGCEPVRVAVSSNGTHVWVTARSSNMLLAFDAAKLESNSSDALVANVQVGTSPVGLTFVNNGRYIITADSDRFYYPNATTGLTVVDVEAALEGKQGFPKIPTGLFPREFAVSPDGKMVLVSEYDSEAIQAVDVSQLGR